MFQFNIDKNIKKSHSLHQNLIYLYFCINRKEFQLALIIVKEILLVNLKGWKINEWKLLKNLLVNLKIGMMTEFS